MSWIDIVVLVIIAVFMIIGCIKGFWKTLASLLGTLICLIVAYIVTVIFLDKLLAVPALNKLFYGEAGSLAVLIKGALPAFGGATVTEVLADPTLITNELGGGIWGVLTPLVSKFVTMLNKNGAYNDVLLTDCVAVVAARTVGWIVFFLLVFGVLKLISLIFKKIGNASKKHKMTKAVDRLL